MNEMADVRSEFDIPTPKPNLIAILGLAGRDTEIAGERWGFRPKNLETTVANCFSEIKGDGRLGAVVALTHMNRMEDKETQRLVTTNWKKWGSAYLLGGHDHHIDWTEPRGPALLTKNISNGRSVTVLLLRKSAIASPPRDLLLDIDARRGSEESRFEDALAAAIEASRKLMPKSIRADFVRAFERMIEETANHRYGRKRLIHDTYWGMGARYVIDTAACDAHAERLRKDTIKLDGKVDLFTAWCRIARRHKRLRDGSESATS
jgi:hypothetical protein